MSVFRLTLQTPPRGKQRPRLGRNGRVFTPMPTRRYEAMIKAAARKVWGAKTPLRCMVGFRCDAYFRRPKEPTKGHPCNTGPVGVFPMGMGGSVYPDSSNVLKAAEDALNGVVYKDDSQVHIATCARWWAAKGEGSSVVINVWRIGPTEMFCKLHTVPDRGQ